MPEAIQQYDVSEKIGEGGMGVVYKGFHRTLERPVAIKRLAAHLSKNQDMLARFLKEARLQAKLSHPNVVNIFDLLEWEGEVYLIMEYVPGSTLKELLQDKGRLPLAEALRIAEGVLAGLAFMHDNGVVHRDIKPSNIIVPESGPVKVTDFGIARLVADDSGLTRFGAGVGTLQYMAPELLKTGEVSFAVDIYGMGVTLYEMLAGQTPFTGNTDLEVMLGHIERQPPPLELPGGEAARACAAMTLKALAKDPAERFATARDFLAEVRRAAAGLPQAGEAPAWEAPAVGGPRPSVRAARGGDEPTRTGDAPPPPLPAPADGPTATPEPTPEPGPETGLEPPSESGPEPGPAPGAQQAPADARTTGRPKGSPVLLAVAALAALVLGGGGYLMLSGTRGPEPVSTPLTAKDSPARPEASAPEAQPPGATPAARQVQEPSGQLPAGPESQTPAESVPAAAPGKQAASGATVAPGTDKSAVPTGASPPAAQTPASEAAPAPGAEKDGKSGEQAQPARPVYVQSRGVRLREAPEATARTLATLEINARLSAFETRDGWVRVATPQGQAGYVQAAQVGETQAQAAVPEKPAAKKPAQGGDAGWRIIK